MSYTIKDIYKWYKTQVDNPVKTEAEFREIWMDYIESVVDEVLLEGGTMKMASRMGDFRVARQKRNPKILMPNWGATNKAKKDGTYTGVIYYLDNYFVRYLWRKASCIVKNKSIWHFKPTRGAKGLKTKLVNKLAEDDLAHLNFKPHGNL